MRIAGGAILSDKECSRIYSALRVRCRRMRIFRCEFQDVVQEAWLSVLWHVGKFDPARGTPFGPYIGQRIHWCVIDAMRRLAEDLSPEDRKVSHPEIVPLDGVLLDDALYALTHDFGAIERQEIYRKLAQVCTERERQIVRMLRREMMQKEIAATLGLSTTYVSEVVASLRRKFADIAA